MSRRRVIATEAPSPSYNVVVITPELGITIESVTVDDSRAEVIRIGTTVVVKRVYQNDAAVEAAVTAEMV